MRRRLPASLVIALLLFYSHAGAQSDAHPKFVMTKPRPSSDLKYEDRFIRIEFVAGEQLHFKLTNKTAGRIQINWDQVSYIDPSSESHRVIHEGVRYMERDKAMPATIVPPTATVTDIIHPSDYVSYDDGWKMRDLFTQPLRYHAGKTFSVFMPLTINGATKDYLFSFKIILDSTPSKQATGGKGTSRTDKSPPLSLESMKRTKVSRDEFPASWPFVVDEGMLACDQNSGAIFFVHQNTIYALNGVAVDAKVDGKIARSLTLIKRVDGNTEAVMNRALSICE